MEWCDAGRSARFGGHWNAPCSEEAVHYIAAPRSNPIKLCNVHFQEVSKAGLVEEPDIGETEFRRREAERRERS